MRLVYITSKKYPSTKVDPFYTQMMAEAFTKLLGKNFLFLIRGIVPKELNRTNADSLKLPKRFRRVFYFILLPHLIFKRGWNNKDTVFLSYDPNLLSILIFWRKVLRFRYKVASDWHQLFDDWRDRFVGKNSDFLICTSKRLKNLLAKTASVPEENILTAYGGVDPKPFAEVRKIKREELKRKLGLPQNKFLVGYVGGFRSVGLKKGLCHMVRALKSLPEDVEMVFVGGSKEHIEEYRELAKKENVADRCIFIKRQPFEKVIEYEIALDALCIPYPNKHHFREYGFPMKIWEYLASGRPLIFSNLAIMSEVLGSRATAFKPEDPDSLAKSVRTIYENQKVAEEKAAKNTEDVLLYTWEKRATHILNLLKA